MQQPRYPVYIISKGRYEPATALTIQALERCQCDYRVVVEPQEAQLYKDSGLIKRGEIISPPSDFRENPLYARTGKAGLVGGSIPVRNFVWEHSIAEGHARHWLIDDNIRYFARVHQNTRLRVYSPAPFRVCEDFADRFENVKMAGLQYETFVLASKSYPPYYLNTRIYSCTLLSNDIAHRWRGKYNEDTRLSLDILKSGYCTIQLNSFVTAKAASSATGWKKGGNTDLYKGTTGRLEFVQELQEDHPDDVALTEKWGRWHHQVDFTKYERNILIPKAGLQISTEPNEYGLRLVRFDPVTRKPVELIDHTKKFSTIL